MAGFMRFNRDIFEEPYFREERYSRRMAFMDLCYMACYKPYSVNIRGNIVNLQSFQLAKSADYLASRWMWNKRTVLCFLSTLQSMGYVTLQKSRIITVITIKKGISDTPQTAPQTAPPSNKDNNDNKEKEREEDIIIPPTPQGEEKEKLLAKIAEMEERQKALEKQNAELKEKIENAKKVDKDIDLSIVSEKMRPIVEEWLAYKKQKRQSYKPQGFVKFYNKLLKDCGGSVAVAKEMVDFSIANNYDGLFKPKGSYRRNELPGQVMRGEEREYNELNFFEG